MDIDEIRWRVDDLEAKRADYRRAAEVWERMWMLKAFRQTPEQAHRENKEQVTLPMPYNIVALAQRLISTEPRIEVPAGTAQSDDDTSAERRERWLTAFWQRVTREQRRDVLADAVWQVLVRGRFCLEAKWVEPLLPAKMKGQRLPILVRTLDPLQVGVKQGPLWTEYAYHKYREERALVRQRYPKLPKGVTTWRSTGELDTVEVIDFWYTDGRDGTVYNCVLVDNEYAQKPVKTNYPDIPIVEGYGDSAPLSSEEHRGLSILHPIRELWPYMCRLSSQIATGLLFYFWPAILIESERGVDLKNLNIGPGTTNALPAGVTVRSFMPDVNMPLAQAMLQQVDSAAQMATFPGVMYGQAPGDIQAGYAVSILADQARGRVNQFRRNLETSLEHLNGIILGLVEANAGKRGVAIWGKSSGDGKLYQAVLTPADIAGIYENLVTLTPHLPTDQVQKLTLWMRMVEAGIVSRRTMRDKAVDEILPADEQLRVDIEQALQSDEMKAKRYLRALQDYFPDEWAQIVAGTPLQQLSGQETPGEPFPPGATPGTPPGPPGGPASGPAPLDRTSVLQGNSGPVQGLQQPIPPELMAQLAAQPGGAPTGSMPPQLPPGIDPAMLAAMQQGAMPPGAMPPGQVPPGIQGIPPQMTGQLTPEALNLPPSLDALGIYQQLAGKALPRDEELDRLMGLPPELRPPGR